MVFCSWVTFWLAKTEKGGEIPARTSLGATTVLTVVTIGFGGKSKPQVSNYQKDQFEQLKTYDSILYINLLFDTNNLNSRSDMQQHLMYSSFCVSSSFLLPLLNLHASTFLIL